MSQTIASAQAVHSPADTPATIDDRGQSEIVVTAQKREQRLLDVPAAVSVLNTSALATSNETRLRDYFDSVPGFEVSPSPGGGNQQVLDIRGVSSGNYANPTVGIMIDGVPFGSSTYDFSPDVDPSDLQRIEVLRGPQGTLYGANSLGGLINYVTIDPSTKATSGRVEAGISSIDHADTPGYAFRGEVNLPLSPKLAVRISGFTTKDPGYVDNPATGRDNVNTFYSSGVHGSLLWQANDDWSLKLSALYQHSDADGSSEVVQAAGLSGYQQNYILNTGQSASSIQAYSAIISGTIGAVKLTSVTGYSRYQMSATQDYSAIAPWGGLAQSVFGVAGAATSFNAGVTRFTQEVRATFKTGDAIDWLIGGFYSNENNPIAESIQAENTTTGAIVGDLISFDIPYKYREYALFADPTLHFSDRFSIQLGARYSWTRADFKSVTEYGAILPTPVLLPEIVNKPHVFTYLVTPQFKVSHDLLIYGRIASGYRPGRSNSFNSDPSVPRAANADTTTNYEVGIKQDLFAHMLSFDASIYYIDWKNLQITLISASNGLAYTANAAHAKSEGGEFSATVRPGAGLKFAGWISVNKAVLTQGVVNAATYAPAGEWLPFSARFSANLSADKSFAISDSLTGSLGATFGHTGKRFGTFIGTPARAIYPEYSKIDLRAGLTHGSWALNIYAKNVANTQGALGGGPGNYPANAYAYLQPRSIGASVVKTF